MMVMILIMKIIFQVLDSYVKFLMIIIKLKNTVPIKDTSSILKINKKVCSQVYLKEYGFINHNYNKNS